MCYNFCRWQHNQVALILVTCVKDVKYWNSCSCCAKGKQKANYLRAKSRNISHVSAEALASHVSLRDSHQFLSSTSAQSARQLWSRHPYVWKSNHCGNMFSFPCHPWMLKEESLWKYVFISRFLRNRDWGRCLVQTYLLSSLSVSRWLLLWTGHNNDLTISDAVWDRESALSGSEQKCEKMNSNV